MKTLAQAYALQAADMRTLTTQLDTSFREYEARMFATEGASGGRRWPALSPRYRRRKSKLFPGRKIMQARGKGRKTLVNKGDPKHVRRWSLKPRALITLGTDHRIFAFHTGAFKNPRLPERNVMQLSQRQRNRYNEIVRDYYRTVKLPRVARILAWRKNLR